MSTYKVILMSLTKNKYGYTPRIEELQMLANSVQNQPLYDNHESFREPIGRILKADVVYDNNLKTLVVDGEVEVFSDERSQKAILEKIKTGGFSPSYIDGGFLVDESDGSINLPFDFLFDAYKTNEIELYLATKKLSKYLNNPIHCLRFRRHFLTETAVFVGLTISSYFIWKILDDIKLYEKLKSYIIEFVGKNKKKEFRLEIIAPEEIQTDIKRLQYTLLGEDEEIKSELDYLKNKKVIELELEKFGNEYSSINKVCYIVEKKDEIVISNREIKRIKKNAI